jgi:hypothetical protein
VKEQLQQLRKSRGLTQDDLAEILGISLSSYQKYERDAISPSYETLCKIADFYHVTTDYLLGREPATDPFDMLQLPEDQKSVMERFASFPDDVRAIILDAIKELAEAAKKRQKLDTTTAYTAARDGDAPGTVELPNEKVTQLLNAETKNNDY